MNESLIGEGAIHSDQPPVEAYPVYQQEQPIPMQVFISYFESYFND